MTKTKLPIPLYARVAPDGGEMELSLSEPAGEGWKLVSVADIDDVLEGAGDIPGAGMVTIWITDTAREARMAMEAFDDVATRTMTSAFGRSPGGFGLVLVNDSDCDANIAIFDKRSPSRLSETEEMVCSWEVDAETYRLAALQRSGAAQRRIQALSAEMAQEDTDFVQSLQSALETIPGAYVPFATESVSGVLSTFDHLLPEEIDEEMATKIHAAILRSASKFEAAGIYDQISSEIYARMDELGLVDVLDKGEEMEP